MNPIQASTNGATRLLLVEIRSMTWLSMLRLEWAAGIWVAAILALGAGLSEPGAGIATIRALHRQY